MSRALLLDLWDLVKPEITLLVALSALAGFLLGSTAEIDGVVLTCTVLGVVLASAGSGALNHYLERHADALMKRTARRPIPSGRVSPAPVLGLGAGLVATALALLAFSVNLLTAGLALATTLTYLFVYTPLKSKTRLNTIIGCLPGALPALGGWTAATGTLQGAGWSLFAVLFLWQMPHFLSLAWMYRKDYARGGFAMLPVVEPDGRSTGFQTFAFSILLLVASLLPWVLGATGTLYLAGAVVMGLLFLRPAWAFFRSLSHQDARRVLKASILYIPALVLVLLVDRLVG